MEAITMLTNAKDIPTEKAELLARIYHTLIDHGAVVEVMQYEEFGSNQLLGRITTVNGVSVSIDFIVEAPERWSSKRVLNRIRVSSYTGIPTVTYPRDKHQQFNVSKLAARLHAVTLALKAKREKDDEERKRESKNRSSLHAFCAQKYGSEYTHKDYKRNIELKADADGFTATLTIHRRVKDTEKLARLLAELEKIVDDRTAS